MRNVLMLVTVMLFAGLFCTSISAENTQRVPILVYHDIHPTKKGSMTISTDKFEQQLKWLRENGYTVIRLRDLVSYLQGKKAGLPDKSVVITVDDGRYNVYKYMWPIVHQYDIPVTLFIYNSAISNADWAMKWEHLRELQGTGYFDVQGHTYWHPNFKQERKRLSPEKYRELVDANLVKSKKIIDEKLNTKVNLLAWPFGIYDEYLEHAAFDSGYEMAFSIDARHANIFERTMSQPRYMVLEGQSMKTFANMIKGGQ